jgi:hypothetical protein
MHRELQPRDGVEDGLPAHECRADQAASRLGTWWPAMAGTDEAADASPRRAALGGHARQARLGWRVRLHCDGQIGPLAAARGRRQQRTDQRAVEQRALLVFEAREEQGHGHRGWMASGDDANIAPGSGKVQVGRVFR